MELTGLNCNGNPLNPLPGVGPKHTDDLCRTIGLAGLLGAVQLVRGINREWAKHVYCAPHTFHLSQGAGDVRRMLEYAGPKLAHVPIDFDGIATLRVFAWEEKADEIHRRMLERMRAEVTSRSLALDHSSDRTSAHEPEPNPQQGRGPDALAGPDSLVIPRTFIRQLMECD
ncbi:MAG: hypothetical protein ACM3ZF_13790 [Mycobacterium leprae]